MSVVKEDFSWYLLFPFYSRLTTFWTFFLWTFLLLDFVSRQYFDSLLSLENNRRCILEQPLHGVG